MIDVRDKVVFLSGPMGGVPDSNSSEFRRVERALYARGALFVYNPSQRLSWWRGGRRGWDAETLMLRALSELCAHTIPDDAGPHRTYDLMVQLHGWDEASGCRLEAAVADAVGIPRATELEVLI
jgi:hypothetical protein